jgi:hypothetical protein
VLLGGIGAAQARPVRFLGAHPVSARFGGGYCYLEAPHMHAYAPDRERLYQNVDGHFVFTGDPTPFGYEGKKHKFYGHHPVVTVGAEPVFCFIDGPHHHPFEAPESPDYKVKDDVAFYVGVTPPQIARIEAPRARVINAEYRPFVALRPTVTVAPPPEWHGEVWVAPPGFAWYGSAARAPRVVVAPPPPPSVTVVAPSPPGVVVSAPGVVVAPPRPRVYVAPPSVHVGGPGVIVAPPGGRVKVKMHGDNGRHRGWYK